MTVELSELSLHLGDFIEKVKAGEHVIVQQCGENIAELRPVALQVQSSSKADENRTATGLAKAELVKFFNPEPARIIAPPPQIREAGSHRGQFELTPAFYEPWPEGFFDGDVDDE